MKAPVFRQQQRLVQHGRHLLQARPSSPPFGRAGAQPVDDLAMPVQQQAFGGLMPGAYRLEGGQRLGRVGQQQAGQQGGDQDACRSAAAFWPSRRRASAGLSVRACAPVAVRVHAGVHLPVRLATTRAGAWCAPPADRGDGERPDGRGGRRWRCIGRHHAADIRGRPGAPPPGRWGFHQRWRAHRVPRPGWGAAGSGRDC